jgi:HTH-type transcriptional regulator/antitoxin HigA
MAVKRVWPDVAIPPGETLAEEIEARGLSQAELARRMGRPVQAVNEIVRGKKTITAATALDLEDALGVSALFWLRLEAAYQLNRARLARRRSRPRRASAVA